MKVIIKKGIINAIWLSDNGKLHPQIIPNLKLIVKDALINNFQIILWTNTKQINESELKILADQNIVVNDFSACSSSKFYSYFMTFYDKGMNGDRAAFALASDILRMSILELSSSTQYYIYFDPNDVTFPDFSKSLAQLDKQMSNNSLGFSFYVKPLFNHADIYHIRNDVLVAKKSVNPKFFEDYFTAYANHLKAKVGTYFKPKTDKEAQDLAREISNQTSGDFFEIQLRRFTPALVQATFGSYRDFYTKIHCFAYERHIENSNTWLPIGTCQEEMAEFKELSERKEIPEPKELAELKKIIAELKEITRSTKLTTRSPSPIPDSRLLPYDDSEDGLMRELKESGVDLDNFDSESIDQMIIDCDLDLDPGCKSRGLLDIDLDKTDSSKSSEVLGFEYNNKHASSTKITQPKMELITYPAWEETRKTIENPSPQKTLSIPQSFFGQIYKHFCEEASRARIQEEHDRQYGLVVKRK